MNLHLRLQQPDDLGLLRASFPYLALVMTVPISQGTLR